MTNRSRYAIMQLDQIFVTKGAYAMKKILSAILVCVLIIGCILTLASCGNISESYAKKINKAAEKDEHYTYDEVVEDLGDNAVDITFLKTGVIVAVKGCESIDDIQAKIDDGKTVKGIVVSIVAGKATSATYKEITKDDLD